MFGLGGKSDGLPYPIPGTYDVHQVSDVTRLLDAVEHGEPQAAEELLPLVYQELRSLAAYRMAHPTICWML